MNTDYVKYGLKFTNIGLKFYKRIIFRSSYLIKSNAVQHFPGPHGILKSSSDSESDSQLSARRTLVRSFSLSSLNIPLCS